MPEPTEAVLARLEDAADDDAARAVEATALIPTDNGLRPGDPEDQPEPEAP